MSGKKETANYPWVFWVSIKLRPKWFSYYWKTRGANYIDYQFWVFYISIGRPWYKGYLEAHQNDYGSAKYIHQSNRDNLKRPFSIKMKP